MFIVTNSPLLKVRVLCILSCYPNLKDRLKRFVIATSLIADIACRNLPPIATETHNEPPKRSPRARKIYNDQKHVELG